MSRWSLAKVPRNRWLAWLLVAVWIEASSSDHGEHLAGSEPFDPVWFSGEADQTNGDVVLIPNGLFRTQHLFAKDRRGSRPLVLFPQAPQLALLVPSSRTCLRETTRLFAASFLKTLISIQCSLLTRWSFSLCSRCLQSSVFLNRSPLISLLHLVSLTANK